MSYDRAFFDYVNSGSLKSAQRLLPILQAQLPVHSVLDVGCGAGAWLSAWRGLGIEDIVGLDGVGSLRRELGGTRRRGTVLRRSTGPRR